MPEDDAILCYRRGSSGTKIVQIMTSCSRFDGVECDPVLVLLILNFKGFE